MNEIDYSDIVKQVLVATFHNESQLGRSMKELSLAIRTQFKKNLLNSIMRLLRGADNGTLNNDKIRLEIRRLADSNDVSVGQSQKVVNVYMKYYCILKEYTNLFRELDCPIDSGIAKAVWDDLSSDEKEDLRSLLPPNLPLGFSYSYFTKLKNIDYPIYEFLQSKLERMGNGIRLDPDIQTYDKRRIEDFLSTTD